MLIFIGVMGVIFLASLAKSTFGFGEGMVNMSLLTLLLGLDQAVPLVAILALGGSVKTKKRNVPKLKNETCHF